MNACCVRVVAVISVAAGALTAVADRAASERLAAEAQTRAAANDYIGAAEKYREAFAEDPRPDLLCNVGVAYYKAKDQLPRAHRYLSHCLEIGTSLDAAFITNVKTVLATVEQRLTTGPYTPVDLLVQPPTATTTVAAVYAEPIVGSKRVWLPHGKHTLVVHAEGYVDRTLEIEAGPAARRESIALQRAPGTKPPEGSGAGSAIETGSAVPPPIDEPPEPARTAPIVATGLTLVVGGAALGAYLLAVQKADSAVDAETSSEWQEIADAARLRQKISWGLGAAAGVGAIATAILWYRASTSATVDVRASGDGASVSLSGRW